MTSRSTSIGSAPRVRSLVERLRSMAEEGEPRPAYTFLTDGESAEEHLSFAELDLRARRIAGNLQAAELKGERAVLLYPPGLDFISAFFGCLYAGVVAVPAYPPRIRRPEPRLRSLVADCAPKVVLTTGALDARADKVRDVNPELASAPWLATDRLEDGEVAWRDPGSTADDLAFLQYTSGSTSDPKGVMVTHGNLVHNEEMIRRAFEQHDGSVIVGWLPLYHDMGLIGNVLQPLYLGSRCVLMSPLAFLQKPLRWLAAISRFRGTTSGGPNFAYDLCVEKIRREEMGDLDLSCWQVAFNGAEPVRAATLERFSAAFADAGFRRSAFYPCYGLAEGTLLVTGGEAGEAPRVETFDAEALEDGRGEVVDGEDGERRVSCGRPWFGQGLEVVDPDTGERRPEGEVGEIWVRGESVAAGYWNRPELTREIFRASPAGDAAGESRPHLRTGDLGFLSGGELFVTGRAKDLLIIRGRNLYAHDVEAVAELADPALRRGSGAVFPVDVDGEERMVVVQEVERRRQDEVDGDRLVKAILSSVVDRFEVRPHEVLVVAAGAVPKTSSGKIRRPASRQLYLDGALPVIARSGDLGAGAATMEATAAPGRGELDALEPAQRRSRLATYLQDLVGRVAGVAPGAVPDAGSLPALGVDSLRVVELSNAVEEELGVRLQITDFLGAASFDDLVALVDTAFEDADRWRAEGAVADARHGDRAPLSPGQRGLWWLDRRAPEEAVYNIGGAVRLERRLDPAAAAAALAELARRHPALRTTFHESRGEPYREIEDELRPELEVESFTGLDPAEITRRLEAAVARPFDLAAGPALRLGLYDVEDGQIVALTVHHLVADLWSLAVLVRDFDALYRRQAEGDEGGGALPRLGTTYDEHVERAWCRLEGEAGETSELYWRHRLEDLEVLDLPLDRPRPPVASSAGAAVGLSLPAAVAGRLRRVARRHDATLFTTLLAAFQALLHRWSGQDDVVVGTPHAGRGHAATADVVGYFVNMVPLRGDLSGRPSFAALLGRTRRAVLADLAHGDYPFPRLAESLETRRDPSRSPIFQVAFALQRSHVRELEGLAAVALGTDDGRFRFAGRDARPQPLPVRRVQYDLTLLAAEAAEAAETGAEGGEEGGLDFSLQYNTDLFDAATVEALARRLERFLVAVAEAPDTAIGEVELLSGADRRSLLRLSSAVDDGAADGGAAATAEPSVLSQVLEQARRDPAAPALSGPDETLTYGELAQRSAALAGRLAAAGVGAGDAVALCLPGSPAMVVAALAAWRRGAAYLPLDPEAPDRRVADLLADSGARCLVTRGERAERLAELAGTCPVVDVAAAPDLETANREPTAPEPHGDQAAYVIYTSGSTGTPNGVVVSHRGLLHLVRWHREAYAVDASARASQVASPAFDAAVWEVWPYLASGASLHFPPREVRSSPQGLAAWLVDEGVTLSFLPTPLAEAVLAQSWPAETALRVLLTGGDRLTRRPGPDLPFRLVNHYGPTEASVVATAAPVAVDGDGPPPIGRPLPHVAAYVVDRQGRLAPRGAVGELWLAGPGLARGYLRRPGLTGERFVPDPFRGEAGDRAYRTGDLVRWGRGGDLEFRGRVDQQVQVRGYRVELGEVESALAAHPAVREAAVQPWGDVLAAYLVPVEGETPATDRLAEHLASRLPAYMVPSAWVELPALPLTANGKLDRRALPAPRTGGAAGEPPRDGLERRLADLWQELLGVADLGRHDDVFALGAHSLTAAQAASRLRRDLGVEVPVREVFAAPTVARLAARIEASQAADGAAMPAAMPVPVAGAGAAEGEDGPLSWAQERLWFLEQLAPGLAVYNVPTAVRLHGPLALGALGAAWAAVARRHGVLRTRFVSPAGEPRQRVVPGLGPAFGVVDLAGLPASRRAAEAGWAAARFAAAPFDLETGPPGRAAVLRGLDGDGGGEALLVVSLHHLVADGWSLRILGDELAELYAAAVEERQATLPALPLGYGDFAAWQREWLRGDELAAQIDWWRDRVADFPAVLELPTDRPRPPVASHRGGDVAVRWDARERAALARFADAAGGTPFMVLSAVFQLLLARYSGQRRLLLGTPMANRRSVEVENLMGLFANTLVLRGDLTGDPSFEEHLAATRREVLTVQEHQDLPFEKLVEVLEPERDLSRNPLFQAMLALQDVTGLGLRFPGLDSEPAPVALGVSRFDLTLFLFDAKEGLEGRLEYASDLFDRATMERFAGHFRTLLSAALESPARGVWELPLLGEAERRQLLQEWAGEEAPVAASSLHGLVLTQAAATPRARALVVGGEALTYGDLDRRSAALAARLRGLGVGPEVRVGVCLERRAELVVTLLAVLRAGGAYVPIDPAYPAQRVAVMVEDSAAAVVVSRSGLAEAIGLAGDPRLLLLDDAATENEAADEGLPADTAVPPDQLAYVLFTSGSTGRPKGVAIPHGAAVAMVSWARRRYSGEELAGTLAATSVCFDLSVFELFVPLAAGGTVILVADALALAEAPERERVVLVNTVPSALSELLAAGALPASVRTVNLAGEALPRSLARRIHATGTVERLYNLYGPSEDTTYSTWSRVEADDPRSPAIGRPLSNSRAYVVDRGLRPVPVGVAGELCLAGAGLARGYLGRPGLTAASFVPDALGSVPGSRLYRTGDLARWRRDGELEYLGRIDHQVKLRGFRIELGEVEAALTDLPGVREAAVLVAGDRLVAYVALAGDAGDGEAGKAGDAAELRSRLSSRLPSYMVPSLWTLLQELPRTPNGKLDRRALPAPAATAAGSEPPRGAVEERLAALWEELLEIDGIGRHDGFFTLGGHSLLATRLLSRVRNTFGVELPVRAVFEAPTVAELARRVEAAAGAEGSAAGAPIPTAEPDPSGWPLSHAQERLWFLDRLGIGGEVYNVPAGLRLDGKVDRPALRAAFAATSRRQGALRTGFRSAEGEPRQFVDPDAGVTLSEIDLGALAAGADAEAARLRGRLAARPFDLSRPPLARAALTVLPPDGAELTLVLHHLVADGWSLGVLVGEVGEVYRARLEGRPVELPELPVRFVDYAAWQRDLLRGDGLDTLVDWWRQRLAGYPTVLELPTDRPRPPVAEFRGGELPMTLPGDLQPRLEELARGHGATPFIALMAVFQVLLARYSGQRRLLVGSPVAHRQRQELEGLVGLFANTLLWRADLGADPGFADLLQAVREESLAVHAHDDLPFERLVEALEPERDLSRNPLFQTMLVLQNVGRLDLDLPGVTAEPLGLESGRSRFDLTLSLFEAGGRLEGRLEYASDLFDRATMERFAGHFRTLLSAALESPSTGVWDLPLLGEAERRQLLEEWAGEDAPVAASSLHGLVLAQAAATPRARALVVGGEALTYGDLDRRSAALAARLRGLGVGPEVRVGVCLERRAELVVTLLAVLRAGGAYVPIDPAYPAQRVAVMVEDSAAAVVVSRSGLAEAIGLAGDPRLLLLDDAATENEAADEGLPADTAVPPDQLAYVLFTSGSTGRPKGVAIPHGAAVAMVSWARRRYSAEELAGTLAATSVCFDLSVFELFVPLAAGGTVILVADALALAEAPERERVVLVNTVPSALSELLAAGALPASVRTVNLAGEALPRSLARRIHATGTVERLYNLYGPSEDTTYSTWSRVEADDPRSPAIGRPLSNSRAYVVDRGLRPVPVGVAGELCLAGAGLARGYLGRPGLTAASFVPDALGSTSGSNQGSRLYRTGDLARWRRDGELEYLGRIDHQVKLRGFRIELGEVEAALTDLPGVREAAVLVAGDRLAAYVALDAEPGEGDAAAELRSRLSSRLPSYMVPSLWTLLEELPRTPNGKLDRRALPAPAAAAAGSEPPRGAVEERLAALWEELLEIEDVGRHDGFFTLGGHSLLATRLLSRVRNTFGVELPVRAVFEAPTVAELALRVEAASAVEGSAGAPIPAAAPDGSGWPLSHAQERLWFLDRLGIGGEVYNVPAALRVEGTLEIGALRSALAAASRRHPMLRTRFEAPEGEVRQHVGEGLALGLAEVDLAVLPDAAAAGEEGRLLRRLASAPFDVGRAPLARAALLRRGREVAALSLVLHHLVADGWSLAVLVGEVGRLYAAAVEGRPVDLPRQRVTYLDYAADQRSAAHEQALEGLVERWLERLGGYPTVLELPTDRPRPAVATHRGDEVAVRLDAGLWSRAAELGRELGATPFMVLMAAYQLLLARYSGQRRMLVGSPVANRRRPELEGLVGLFINALVWRGEVPGEADFRGLVAAVREESLAVHELEELPFEKLVEAAQPERDLSRNPIFQVMLALQNVGALELDLPGAETRPLPAGAGTSRFDLTLTLMEQDGGLTGAAEYASDLFDAGTIERLVGHLGNLLAAAVESPTAPVWDLPILAAGEREQLLVEWNDSAEAIPDRCVHQLFAERVAARPDAEALVFAGRSLTYRQLDRRANALAHRLGALGVGPEARVGVFLDRGEEMVVALLAILKAGGAYVPLDPSYPAERTAFILDDCRARVLVTTSGLGEGLDELEAHRLDVDGEELAAELEAGADRPPAVAVAPGNLAYAIYTSGSTGRPKGVLVTHANAVNFFVAMDGVLGHEDAAGGSPGTWLAVTSISFDISVLELLWTLARGYRVVLQADAGGSGLGTASAREARRLDFSLFYFANDQGQDPDDRYRLLTEGATFADRNGFCGVWTPERHFHPFGGLYPNPSVTGAAVAALTKNVEIRAGSVVLPLHDPIRIAEEWSVVDNLSHGRVSVSFASGWHADDFVLAPEDFAERRRVMAEGIETVRHLWRGGAVTRKGGAGNDVEVRIYPRPVQPELPLWVTAAGNPDTFHAAGESGAGLLTHLLGQSLDELGDKIALYRRAWREAGHGPGDGRVALMLHTFVGDDPAAVRRAVETPFRDYLRSSLGLMRGLAKTLGMDVDGEDFGDDDFEALLDHAFERYYETASLFGTEERGLEVLARLRTVDVDEVACLIDFGVDTDAAVGGLEHLRRLKQADDRRAAAAARSSIPVLLREHGVSHFQCTPSMARMLAAGDDTLDALGGLDRMLVGGEALAPDLARHLAASLPAELHNMYGPTETTVWSASHRVTAGAGPVPIGRPLANNRLYVLDRRLRPVPAGVQGELFIAGDGVTRGYLERPRLTAQRYVPDPFSRRPGGRLYRTSDLVRLGGGGDLEFLGRADHQVKLRGHRIEPGEIEVLLAEHAEVAECVVVLRQDRGAPRLVAYLVPAPGAEAADEPTDDVLRDHLRGRLPDYMVPAAFVRLGAFPLTPNGKVDRKALPAPEAPSGGDSAGRAPAGDVEGLIAEVWQKALEIGELGVDQDFFDLGGHSLLATQVMSRLSKELSVELPLRLLFEERTVARLARRVEAFTRGGHAGVEAITPVERDGSPLPVSFAQYRLWFLHQMEPDSAAFNMPSALRLDGRLQAGALEAALGEIFRRHEVLRTTFQQVGGEPVQAITPAGPYRLPRVDLARLSGERGEGESERLLTDESRRPFDLRHGPVVRTRLLTLAADRHLLIFSMHHIVADAWSRGVLVREIGRLYADLASGRPPSLPEPALQYADFAQWQRRHLQGEVWEEHVGYWRRQLAGAPLLELPADRPRGEEPAEAGAHVSRRLPAEPTQRLQALAREAEATPFAAWVSAFQVLLHWITGDADLVLGTDVANRNRTETEALAGFFINQLALRFDLSGDPTFRDVLEQGRGVLMDAYAHQDLPFDRLVEILEPNRSSAAAPVFEVKLNFQNVPVPELELPDLRLTPVRVEEDTAQLDLIVNLTQDDEGLLFRATYRVGRFDGSRVEGWMESYRDLLLRLAEDPGLPLSQLTAHLDRAAEERRREAASRLREASRSKMRGARRRTASRNRPTATDTSNEVPQ